ncbi:MAG: L,D-peptidoglycan transpeptidase YkuD (ErfK/YbiS/YcfS/YnhG family) [Akkermansiaceae bacterium]|jgi:L,D-peptidoglycan transpeptidase YkuD (ErfK/YbiS/YcfS/YnhG family)|tara:strand:- start:2319 stop:3035 length:717 start_codon:yes stop_codon:yes gene_type:complete
MKILIFLLTILPLVGQSVPATSKQAVVAYTSSWNSSYADLYLYQRNGTQWEKVSDPIKVRLGRKGSAWGLGIHSSPKGATLKKEGDVKSPAGIFFIGGAWGDAPAIHKHPKLPYRKVTPRDLWVEDSKSPYYNQHRILPHQPKTAWEKKQQMKQNDFAHSLKLFIAHNPPPKAKPYAGSAVFFHIWRGGGSKPTAGCTTMSEENLMKLVAWLDPTKQPVYVLLSVSEYKAKRDAWKLP